MTTTADRLHGSGIDLTVPWCLNDDHRAWRETVRAFAENVVRPGATERNIEQRFDPALVPRAAELGMFGMRVSEQHGGTGADLTSFCLAIEELARVDSGVAVTVHVAGISAALLEHLATDDEHRALLPRFTSGEQFVCFGLTEPSSGTDAGRMATRARRDGEDWILNGAKQFITNAGTPMATHVIVFAATGERADGRPGVSAFLVPTDVPGFTVGGEYPKLGWRSSDTRPLFFDDVRLGPKALLGEEGHGYREALRFLTWARLPIAAMSVGLAQACLELTVENSGDRMSFGKPIGAHQYVAFRVADMAAMVATARTVTYDACYKADHGFPFDQEAAICKFVASEIANRVAYLATQLHGGYGFVDETEVTRHYRDARILTIGEGTSEVQRMLIARSLGLPT
jgi:short/branched chain acyl-CoA dehydrogenase